MPKSPEDRVIESLTRPESDETDELLAIIVDHALDKKLRELVDFEETRAIVVRALTKENLERIFERHVIPGYSRYAKHASDSPDTVGSLVPDEARNTIIEVIQKSKLPRGKWAEGAVDRVLIGRLFAPVWTNLLVSFAKRLPLPGMGGGGGATGGSTAVGRGARGIAGRITRSAKEQAEKLVDAGKSVMGGLGSEVERRLQSAAKEFSDGAADLFREALNERLKSAEGRELVAQISRQATDHVLVTKVSEIHEDARRFPVEDVLRLTPSIVAHAAPRAFVQAVVRQEIDAFLVLEGDRPLRDVLDELGILEDFRRAAVARAKMLASGLFESPAFRDWLGRLLGDP
jgi:hypothetical protein